jgi:hypothetical protein
MTSERADHNVADPEAKAPMPNATRSEILTVPELAGRLRVAPSWVYGHADLLGAYRLGKYLRFDWRRVLERLATDPALRSQSNDHQNGQ